MLHTEQNPHMSETEIDFAYDSLFPFLKQILRKHYRPDAYSESQVVLIEILKPICEFIGKDVLLISINLKGFMPRSRAN